MSEDATLRDTVVDPGTETQPETTVTTTEPTTVKVADNEAAKIGQALLEAGITVEQVPQLLEAPGALNALRHLVQNNPQEFLNQLEKTDPTTGNKFLQEMADIYLKRNEHKITDDKVKKSDKTDELFQEVQALKEKASQLERREAERVAATQTAALKSRYESRVEDLFSQKEIKELGLKSSEVKNMKARIHVELSNDPTIVRRISNGNFVDVPKTFQTILDEHVADKKTAIEADKAARDRQTRSAFAEFPNGPQTMTIDPKSFDSWDATEEALAKALVGQ